MRTDILPQTQPAPDQPRSAQALRLQPAAGPALVALNFRCPLPLYSCAILAVSVALMASGAQLGAQLPAARPPAPQNVSTQNPAQAHTRPSAAQPVGAQDPAPAAAPVPETPKWPVFDQPAPASVVWNTQGLRIDASNSSLQQILNAVSTAIGAKVEGFGSDQRVFGAYGPGRARDVLSQLLQGSGYNVIMVGDQGHGTPRQVLLSVRETASAQAIAKNAPANNSSDDDDADDQPPLPEQAPNHPGFPPRSPQQIMQEMQQRQQQMQQQQTTQPPPQNNQRN